jgi:AcrR family transcriptional regulator
MSDILPDIDIYVKMLIWLRLPGRSGSAAAFRHASDRRRDSRHTEEGCVMAHPGDGTPRIAGAGADETRRSATRRRETVMGQIMDHAMSLFAEQGYERTTLQDIADLAGVSRPNLYNYVGNKEELLVALVEQLSDGAAAELTGIRKRHDLDPTEKLHTLVRSMVLERAAHPAHFRTLDRADQSLPPGAAGKHLENRRTIVRGIVAIIEDGITAGQFRPVDPRITALSILGMCNWVAWWFVPSPDHPAEPVADQIAANTLTMIAETGASSPRVPTPIGAAEALRRDLDYLVGLLEKGPATHAAADAQVGK